MALLFVLALGLIWIDLFMLIYWHKHLRAYLGYKPLSAYLHNLTKIACENNL